MMENRSSSKAIIWFFVALFLISIYLLGKLLWPFISVLILGAVLTGVFEPVYRPLAGRIGPPYASAITCCCIFVIIFVPILFFVGMLSKEAYGLYLMGKDAVLNDQIRIAMENSRLIERLNVLLSAFDLRLTGEQLNAALSETGKVVGLFLYEQASAIASNALRFMLHFFFMLLVTYYLLIDGDRLRTFIVELSPLPDDQDEQLIRKFKGMAGAILLGNGLCGLIQGVLGGVVFYFTGFPSALMWGVIMGFLAFLPIVGIGIIFLPAAGYLLLTDRIAVGVFYIVFYIVLSGGVEYLLKPKIVGTRVQMHTLLVFLAIMGGLQLFGILGIIYGPLVVTAFLTLTEIYHANYEQLMESDAR